MRVENGLINPYSQLTWDAEGQDTGPFATEAIHWSGGAASGVNIGRGYDMGYRSAAEVMADMMRAGLSASDAALISSAAGLRGNTARNFVARNQAHFPALSKYQQLKLFSEITYPKYEAEALRISSKPDVVRRYGRVDFELLSEDVFAVMTDLVYRGDYTPETREIIQPALVSGERDKICEKLDELNAYQDVPKLRAQARMKAIGCE